MRERKPFMTTHGLLAVAGALALALVVSPAFAQATQDRETTIAGVVAHLAVVKSFDNTLMVAVALRNPGRSEAGSSTAIDFSKFVLVDAAGGVKHACVERSES